MFKDSTWMMIIVRKNKDKEIITRNAIMGLFIKSLQQSSLNRNEETTKESYSQNSKNKDSRAEPAIHCKIERPS